MSHWTQQHADCFSATVRVDRAFVTSRVRSTLKATLQVRVTGMVLQRTGKFNRGFSGLDESRTNGVPNQQGGLSVTRCRCRVRQAVRDNSHVNGSALCLQGSGFNSSQLWSRPTVGSGLFSESGAGPGPLDFSSSSHSEQTGTSMTNSIVCFPQREHGVIQGPQQQGSYLKQKQSSIGDYSGLNQARTDGAPNQQGSLSYA